MPPGHEHYFGTVRVADRTFDTSGLAYGYLAGSATDLAHLAIPLLDRGRYGDKRFLSENTVAAVQRGGPEAGCGRYALGWRQCALADTPVVWHAGAVTGYHSVLIAAPEAGWAIAVQQNVYSPLQDEALNSAAFGALTIALGGTPDAPSGDSTHTVALIGLSGLTLALAGALAWSIRLLVRRPARPLTWRAWSAGAAWIGLGVLSAAVVGWLLPGVFDLELRHIVRFMPDIGHLAVAIGVLGSALAVTRLAVLVVNVKKSGHGSRRSRPRGLMDEIRFTHQIR